ncbi:Pleiotropic drug resistance protein 1 [Spatholobus suberectus]|nr:Pleiotropic drug resistance protein 1 [Spatholobus suberectus]
MNRIDGRQLIPLVGVDIPIIEVRFEHLNVEANVHVGNRALPTLTNYMVNIVEMTLLVGPPSSGKTTLILALAGKLNPNLKFNGKVTYNGHEMNEFVPQRTAAYVSQNDLHIGEMTVRETLAYSPRFQGVGPGYDILAEVSRREKEANIVPDLDIDIYMKILGLEICADIFVGNEMLRGVSGGQRKRVTTGEMLVGPAKALFMDEISTAWF